MKWLLRLLSILAAVYLLIAVIFASFVCVLGGNFTTALAVGIQWPRIFWRK